MVLSDMKFFMWYRSYAIYGARETLILLQPNLKDAAVGSLPLRRNTISIFQVEIFAYDWSIDSGTMDECLQEWNTKVPRAHCSPSFEPTGLSALFPQG